MSTGATEVTPESYALSAVLLAFVTAGMKRDGEERKKMCEVDCAGEDLCFPRDIFGDSHSFVVVLA